MLSTAIYRPGEHDCQWTYLVTELGQHITFWSREALALAAEQVGLSSLGYFPGNDGFCILLSRLPTDTLKARLDAAAERAPRLRPPAGDHHALGLPDLGGTSGRRPTRSLKSVARRREPRGPAGREGGGMRIVVASTYVPFLSGGGIKVPQDLATALRRAGHQVETVMIPMYSGWPRIAEQTVAIRLLNLTESCGDRIDRLITVRTPAYALSHPDKVVWFLHHHRAAYDLWGTPFGDMPDSPEARSAREMMVRSDTLYLRKARRVYTISRAVADRIRKFNGLEPDGVLYPPLLSDHPFRPGPFGDYFIYASRFCPHKRQDLAIEAMRYVRSGCRLILTGVPDVPGYDRELMELARQLEVVDRVEFVGWVSRSQTRRVARGLPRGAGAALRRGLRLRHARAAARRQARDHLQRLRRRPGADRGRLQRTGRRPRAAGRRRGDGPALRRSRGGRGDGVAGPADARGPRDHLGPRRGAPRPHESHDRQCPDPLHAGRRRVPDRQPR